MNWTTAVPTAAVSDVIFALTVAPGESLRATVDRIKTELELAPELTAAAGIREANAAMGLTDDGLTLPAQADRLLAKILG